MAAELHYLSLDEISRQLRARKLSSVEATQAILDRIARLDARLKSFATLIPERALADAAARDAESAAGKSRGPLHGVPIAVKDLCNTAGVPTAAGMATLFSTESSSTRCARVRSSLRASSRLATSPARSRAPARTSCS